MILVPIAKTDGAQGENIPAGWLLEWQRVGRGRGAPPDSPCYFFVTIPKSTF